MLQQALELEPPVRVARQGLDLRDVGRVVGDGPVQEPVSSGQRLGRVPRRLRRADGARGRGDGLAERRLRAEGGDFRRVDAVEELVVDCVD